MIPVKPLSAAALRRSFDLSFMQFKTTEELKAWSAPFAQERAIEAIEMGLRMHYHGYNLYLMGSQGLGKHRLVRQMMHQHMRQDKSLFDWCYIHNFDQDHKPLMLKLPQGLGAKLKKSMDQFTVEFVNQLNTQLNAPEFQRELQEIKQKWVDMETEVFGEIGEEANSRGFSLSKTEEGYSLIPEVEGEALTEKVYKGMSEAEQARIESDTQTLKDALMKAMRSMSDWEDQQNEEIHQLEFAVFKNLTDSLMRKLEKTYAGQLDIGLYLAQVKQDILQNMDDFKLPEEQKNQLSRITAKQILETYPQYQVNLLVDNAQQKHMPIVYEEHPSFSNLMGRIEHTASMGALVTDFTHIKPGSLHQANGGYLIIDTHRLLSNPYAWDALKRSLRAREIRMEPVEQSMNMATTNTLEPQAIPLDIKVVLCGDRDSYFLLQEYDPEFNSLFKVMADFSETLYVPEGREALLADYVGMMAHLQTSEGLMPLTRGAVEEALRFMARRLDDTAHLSLNRQEVLDVLREAHYWASLRESEVIELADLHKVEESRLLRHSRISELDDEGFERGLTLVQTQGAVMGQVNALSVIDFGEMSYGHPSRVTASVYAGDSGITDIERESDMAGNIHTKGVMILTAWLSNRYAQKEALSLSANLAFEQNYGGVDGDSATLAEATALLSALSKLPVNQALAITGSMNQLGQVQAVGGLNAKIESFFDLANKRGLVPGQGVIMPASNQQHLMLKPALMEAVEAGSFSIYPVETIDQAVTLLLGQSMDEVDRLVSVRLQKWKNHKTRADKRKDES